MYGTVFGVLKVQRQEVLPVKLLFLRGQVPTDRPKEQIMFTDLASCDDVWTQLGRGLVGNDYGEIWYWGGQRTVRYDEHYTDRWLSSFDVTDHDFDVDVIFARGGFQEYDKVLRRHPKAVKVYYGAGRRYLPPKGYFSDFDLVLVDHPFQLQEAQKRFNARLFIKPASENVFKPRPGNRLYDVIMVSNYTKFKGVDLFLSKLPRSMRALVVGIMPPHLRQQYPYVTFKGWLSRHNLPALYAQSTVSVCCANFDVDSNPRVVVESIACDCPVVVLDTVRLWQEKYITPQTGRVCGVKSLIQTIQDVGQHRSEYAPRRYYDENLSMNVAVRQVTEAVRQCHAGRLG